MRTSIYYYCYLLFMNFLFDSLKEKKKIHGIFSFPYNCSPLKLWISLFYYHWSLALSFIVCFRLNGPGQTFSNVEMGSPPAHDLQAAYIPSMSKPFHLMPHVLQNSPSRFGHQSVQRYTHGRPPQVNDWNQIKIQTPPSGFSSVGPRSPRNASFTSSMAWGILFVSLFNY